jgi:hypothetical protein
VTKAEQAARDLQEAYRHIFAGPHGDLVKADLRAKFRLDAPCFIVGSEQWQPAFRDGAKSVVHYIFEQIESIPNEQQTPTIIKK